MNDNIFDKELLNTEPEPETFFNIFSQDVEVSNEDIHKLHYQFSELTDMERLEVYNLAQIHNKMKLYYMITMKEEGRGFERISSLKESNIQLPTRSTANSAGYDFYAPNDFTIPSSLVKVHKNGEDRVEIGNPFMLSTGIKAYMKEDEVLLLFNRSSNPKKKSLILANGVGCVDADYYNNPDNEGEIGFLFYNMSSEPVEVKKGDKIGQGIFQKYLLIDGDDATGLREGGFGSTGA